MLRALVLAALAAAPISAQTVATPAVPLPAPIAPAPTVVPQVPWDPATAYVTAGQDEPGYRSWYLASPAHRVAVTNFNAYLTNYGVGGILPTWQLLRTATAWEHCGAQPFEVPPISEWPNIVQTLRYVHDYVIPAVGPVEPVSAYRNSSLNICAGGAPESAHKHYSAIDMVPLRPTTRHELMQTLCAVHARRGLAYGVGLGFYAFLRFHVDTTKFRRWGADPDSMTCPPIIRPEDAATVYQPATPAAPVASTTDSTPAPAPAASPPAKPDPLAPAPQK